MQIFSTYESRHDAKDAKPFARGINSFQLYYDGSRWWVVTILWQEETPENPLPKNSSRPIQVAPYSRGGSRAARAAHSIKARPHQGNERLPRKIALHSSADT